MFAFDTATTPTLSGLGGPDDALHVGGLVNVGALYVAEVSVVLVSSPGGLPLPLLCNCHVTPPLACTVKFTLCPGPIVGLEVGAVNWTPDCGP